MKTKLLMVSAIFSCYLFNYSAYAQDKYDAIYDKIAKEACECMEKDKELPHAIEAKNLKTVELKLGACMITPGIKYKKSLPEKYQDLMHASPNSPAFGEQIALKCINHCPELMGKIGTLYNEQQEKAQNTTNSLSAEVESVTPISAEYMLVFHVKETDGTTHTLLWENKPEGPDEFISRPETLKGKTVKFDYELQDVYSAKTQTYVKVKKIVGVSAE